MGKKMITIGFSPAWDVVCKADGLDWGGHKVLAEKTTVPAGKALNISKALCGLGRASVAAGLWGADDYPRMRRYIERAFGGNKSATEDTEKKKNCNIELAMTVTEGATRENITVIDKSTGREMHLRDKSSLATKQNLSQLEKTLEKRVDEKSICVFSGAMPEGGLFEKAAAVIETCKAKGAKVAVDSSGEGYKKIVDKGGLWLIKPNVEELCVVVGRKIDDNSQALAEAAKPLLEKAEIVLVSRGKNGALAVTTNGVFESTVTEQREIVSTVACGDYFLAGFLNSVVQNNDIQAALSAAVKMGSQKAWGMAGK
ncbi:MAG: PfkB family carbohydrate kinase [Phycisphaerae bacterium]|nr:PfkB family carbohydrate kinase [Phycisphaerae bacterium]